MPSSLRPSVGMISSVVFFPVPLLLMIMLVCNCPRAWACPSILLCTLPALQFSLCFPAFCTTSFDLVTFWSIVAVVLLQQDA